MGTPERQIAPLSVILGEVTCWYDELDNAAWIRIIEKALISLGPLKNVSGFKPISGFLNSQFGRGFCAGVRPDELSFEGRIGFTSLSREMITVFESQSAEKKEEQRLFLLKEGGFGLFTGSYAYVASTPDKGSSWRPLKLSFVPAKLEHLSVLSEKRSIPSLFWAELFQGIYELSMADRDLKQGRADLAREGFWEIDRMKSTLNLPEYPG